MMSLALLLAVTGPTTVAGDLTIEVQFDQTTIRQGDFAYCEAGIRNTGKREISFDKTMSMAFSVKDYGETFEGDSIGSGGVGGASGYLDVHGKKVVGVNEYMPITVVQIPVSSGGSLRYVPRQTRAYVTPGFHCDVLWIRAERIGLSIVGDIGDSKDLAMRVWVPPGEQPKMTCEDKRRLSQWPLLWDFGLREAPWTWNSPDALEALAKQLDPESAAHRIVAVTGCVRDCIAAGESDKSDAVNRLVAQFDRCGSAERKWFVRTVLAQFLRFGDRTSRDLVLERTDPALRAISSGSELSLDLRFDCDTVRRGDPCYCEVRVYNWGLEPKVLPVPDPEVNTGFSVHVVGGPMRLAHLTGGAGCFTGQGLAKQVPPGGCTVGFSTVPLFTGENLREMRGVGLSHAVVTAGVAGQVAWAGSHPVIIPVEGDISKNLEERDVVAELYVPFNLQPAMPKEWCERMRNVPRINSFRGFSFPWTMSVPVTLAQLREDLDPQCAMHRAASITLALQQCVFAKDGDKPAAVAHVAAELERCGHAEREWFIRWHIGHCLSQCGDKASARLFQETFPSSARPYEVSSSPEKQPTSPNQRTGETAAP